MTRLHRWWRRLLVWLGLRKWTPADLDGCVAWHSARDCKPGETVWRNRIIDPNTPGVLYVNGMTADEWVIVDKLLAESERPTSTSVGYGYSFSVTDVRVWSRKLTDEEMRLLHKYMKAVWP